MNNTHLTKATRDLEDVGRALSGFSGTRNDAEAADVLYAAMEALTRATASLLRHAEVEATGKANRDWEAHCRSAGGGVSFTGGVGRWQM